MAIAAQPETIQRLIELGERAAAGTPIEIADVELRGSGGARLLRVYIDKPGGVTHGDCELVSERLGQMLDDQDIMPEGSYTLEVSSPGVERKLTKSRDFERAIGQKIKLSIKEPIEGKRHIDGKLVAFRDSILEIEASGGTPVRIPLDKVQKANLKFEW